MLDLERCVSAGTADSRTEPALVSLPCPALCRTGFSPVPPCLNVHPAQRVKTSYPQSLFSLLLDQNFNLFHTGGGSGASKALPCQKLHVLDILLANAIRRGRWVSRVTAPFASLQSAAGGWREDSDGDASHNPRARQATITKQVTLAIGSPTPSLAWRACGSPSTCSSPRFHTPPHTNLDVCPLYGFPLLPYRCFSVLRGWVFGAFFWP